MNKVNFFHNFELFKKHLNFKGSAEQPKRLDIVKLAYAKAKKLDIIQPHKIEPSSFDNSFKAYIETLHPQKHIFEIKNFEKIQTALFPLQALTQTIDKSIQK